MWREYITHNPLLLYAGCTIPAHRSRFFEREQARGIKSEKCRCREWDVQSTHGEPEGVQQEAGGRHHHCLHLPRSFCPSWCLCLTLRPTPCFYFPYLMSAWHILFLKMKYNLHMIKITQLKCSVQWVLVYSQGSVTAPPIWFQNIFITPNGSPDLFSCLLCSVTVALYLFSDRVLGHQHMGLLRAKTLITMGSLSPSPTKDPIQYNNSSKHLFT